MKPVTRSLFFLSAGVCLLSGILFAEMVTDVGGDGTLTLADGKRVALAGIHMDEDGVSVLRVLAGKQDVKLEMLSRESPGGRESAYVYLQSKSVKFSGKTGARPSEKEVLLNEFLVEVGAAKVVEAQEFSRKDQFLKVQAAAKKKGEGVWSYVS